MYIRQNAAKFCRKDIRPYSLDLVIWLHKGS